MVLDPRRILLIRRKALGDALVTLPAILAVAQNWPRARIDLVIDRPFAELMGSLVPGVNVMSWPPPSGSSFVGHLVRTPYDLVVDWLGSPRTALWTVLSGASVRVGYDLPRRRWAYNVRVPRNYTRSTSLRGFAGEAFLDPLRVLGLQSLPWPLPETDVVGSTVDTSELGDRYRQWRTSWCRRPTPRVALVMSATWSAKAWPTEHVVKLVSLLQDEHMSPLVVAGPGDEALVAELTQHLAADLFAPPTTLLELADLFEQADLFVGTDNGARHLATRLGLPTVTMFGPTDPVGWNPEDPRHVAVSNPVPCAPCNLTECPVPGRPCLRELAPEKVVAVLRRLAGDLQK